MKRLHKIFGAKIILIFLLVCFAAVGFDVLSGTAGTGGTVRAENAASGRIAEDPGSTSDVPLPEGAREYVAVTVGARHTYFERIEDAFSAANGYSTVSGNPVKITLFANFMPGENAFEQKLTVDMGHDITLDLNGYILERKTPQSADLVSEVSGEGGEVVFVNGGRFTLADSWPMHGHAAEKYPTGGVLTGGNNNFIDTFGDQTGLGGAIFATSVRYQPDEFSGYETYPYAVEIAGGSVWGNRAYRYGGIYGEIGRGGSVTVSGGKIFGNTSELTSQALYANMFVMAGGEISEGLGGGVFSYSTARVEGGKICGNGGVGVTAGSFIMTGGEICGNAGSGVWVSEGATVSGGKIYGNSTSGEGGGIRIQTDGSAETPAVVSVTGGEIFGNSARLGGGIYLGSSSEREIEFIFDGGRIYGNDAETGGGIYLGAGKGAGKISARFSGGEIAGNNATEKAGGVYARHNLSDAEVALSIGGNARIIGNVLQGTKSEDAENFTGSVRSNILLGGYVSPYDELNYSLSGRIEEDFRGEIGIMTEILPTFSAPISAFCLMGGAIEEETTVKIDGPVTGNEYYAIVAANTDGQMCVWASKPRALGFEELSAQLTGKLYEGVSVRETAALSVNKGGAEFVERIAARGTSDYAFLFMPTDRRAYLSKEYRLNLTAVGLKEVSASFAAGSIIFTSTTFESVKEDIRFLAIYTDGFSRNLEKHEYTVSLESGEAYFAAGENAVLARYEIPVAEGGNFVYEIPLTISAEAVTIAGLGINFSQGNILIYDNETAELFRKKLEDRLTVTKYYNDGSSAVADNYILSADLTAGGSVTVTVTLPDAAGISATFEVEVTPVTLESLNVAFSQTGAVYPSTSLDALRNFLVVTGTNNDGSAYNEGNPVSDYALSGTLTAGNSLLTVTVEGVSATFGVEVTAIALDSISAVIDGNVSIHTTDTIEFGVKPFVTVTGKNNDGSDFGEIADFTVEGDLSAAGEISLTVKALGKETTLTVTVTETALKSLSVQFDAGERIFYTSDPIEDLRAYFTVTGMNADGSDYNGGAAIEGYRLAGVFVAGTSVVTVAFEGVSATVNVSVAQRYVLVTTAEGKFGYDNLYAAFAAISDGTLAGTAFTVSLWQDATLTEGGAVLNAPKNSQVTLDLNGYVIDRGLTERTENGYVLNLDMASNVVFRLEDSAPGRTHADSSLPAGGVITGGFNSGNGGGIYLSDWVTFYLEGGSVFGNTAQRGGGIYGGKQLEISGGRMEGNSATTEGGALFTRAGLTVTGGVFTRNSAATIGGGIYSASGGDLVISGGEFSYNGTTTTISSLGWGGALYRDAGGYLTTISGGRFIGNRALEGGALYLKGSSNSESQNISGGEFSGNFADWGGAICLAGKYLRVSGGSIEGNTAAYGGGGIYTYGTRLDLLGGRISGNAVTAQAWGETPKNRPAQGGGVYAYRDVSVDGSAVVEGNTAGGVQSNLYLSTVGTSLVGEITKQFTGRVGLSFQMPEEGPTAATGLRVMKSGYFTNPAVSWANIFADELSGEEYVFVRENVGAWEQFLYLYRKGETPTVHPVVTGRVYGNQSYARDLQISVSAGDTPGTFTWVKSDQLLKVGLNTLEWEFIPADGSFTRAQGSVQVNVQGAIGLRAEMTRQPEVYIGSKASAVSDCFDIYLVYADGTEIKEDAPLVTIPESGDVFREGTNRIELTIYSSRSYSQTGEPIKTVAYIDNVEIAPVEMTIVPYSGREEDALHYVFGSLEEAAKTMNERNDNYYDETVRIWLNRDIFPTAGVCFDLTEYTLTLDLKGHIIDFSRSKATTPGIYVGSKSWYEGSFTLEDSVPDATHPEREEGFPAGGVLTGAKYSALYVGGDEISGEMTGGTFYRNSAPERVKINKNGNLVEGAVGGAITIASNGYFCLYGGSIRDNLAEGCGGGLLAFSSLQVRGGEIAGNRAMISGGGIYIAAGTLELIGGKISGNTADISGGGVGVKPRETDSGAKLRLGLAPTVQNNFVLANRVGGTYAGGIPDNIRFDVSGGNYFELYNTFRGEVGIRTEPIRKGETYLLCKKPTGFSDQGKILLDDADCELTLKEVGENSVWYIGGAYAPSTVTPVFGTFYLGESLPEISLSEGDTPGTIVWEEGQSVNQETKVYYWSFTAADTVNYNVRRGACLVTAYGVERIDVRFDAPEKLFTGTDLDTLKNYLSVTAVYGDEVRKFPLAPEDYSLTFADGRAALLPGLNTIEVRYFRDGNVLSETFTVEVLSVELESISAEFEQGDIEVYPSTSVEELKDILGDALKVNMHLTNGTQKPAQDFKLSGTLAEGISRITVELDGFTAEFDLKVTPIVLDSFSVTFERPTDPSVLFRTDTATPEDFRPYLSFEGWNNDGSTYTGDFSEVEISFPAGRNWFEPGESELVAAYKGISAHFTVYLTPYPVETRFGEEARGFQTLTEALAAIGSAPGNYWIKLYQTSVISARITVGADQVVILDLNGRKLEREVAANPNINIQAEYDGSVIYVEGTLTVRDSDPDYGHGTSTPAGGLITGGRAVKGGGIWVNGGSLTLEGGTIYNNLAQPQWKGSSSEGYGSGVYVNNGGTFVMTGGAVSRNRAEGYGRKGTGVYIESSTFEMSGGGIYGSSSQEAKDGGGIYASGTQDAPAVLRISGGEIAGNYASGYGAGISLWGNTTLEFTGGKIRDNILDFTGSGNAGYGGGVYVGEGAKFVMGGGEIYSNRAQTADGGGVELAFGGTFEMTAGSIYGNYAQAYGGGVSASGVFRISGGEIRGNEANRGGGLSVDGGNSGGADGILSGGEIRYNTASKEGAGIYFRHYEGKLTLDGNAFVTDNCFNGYFSSTVGGYVGNTKSNIMYWTGGFVVEESFAGQAGVGTNPVPTAGNPVSFGTGSSARLFADNDQYGILEKEGMLYLELLLPKPDVTVSLAAGKTYRVGDALSVVSLVRGGSTPGSVTLGEGCLLQGVYEYEWTFTPEDTSAYRVLKGSIRIDAVQISALKPVFEPMGNEIFTSTALGELKKYLSVTAEFGDGTARTLTQEEISALALTVPDGALTAGENAVEFVFAGFGSEFTVKAQAVRLESIAAEFDAGTESIYDSTELNALKKYLTVTGRNNDGSDYGVISDYSILGSLHEGANTLTVEFVSEGDTFTAEFSVEGVVAQALISIEITEKPAKTEYTAFEIFDGTGMVVTAKFNDGSSRELGADEYQVDVAGMKLENDIERVNVTYTFRGVEKNTGFGIRVNRISVALPGLDAEIFDYDGAEKTAFTGDDSLFDVSGHTGTLPGEYTAVFVLKDKSNYAWETSFNGRLSWSIRKGRLEVRTENYSGEYDKGLHTGSLTATASDGRTPTVLYGTVEGEYALSSMPTFADAGDYTVYFRASLEYYEDAEGAFTVTIRRAEDVITADDPGTEWQTWTYGQSIVLPSFETLSGGEVSVAWENGAEPKNAGFYKLILTTPESKNYLAGRLEIDIRILKATYDSADLLGVNALTGVFDRNKTLADYQLPEAFSWKTPGTLPTVAVREYAAYYNTDPQNYENYEVQIAVHLSKMTVAAPGNPASVGYNGTNQRTAIFDTLDYTVLKNEGGRNAGRYEVLLRLKDPDNTAWAEGTVLLDGDARLVFVIEQAKVTVTIADQRSAQGKPLPDLNQLGNAWSVSGTVFGADTLGITLSTDAKSDRVGLAKITGRHANLNYDVAFVDGSYEVYSIDGYLAFIRAHGETAALNPGEIGLGDLPGIESMSAVYGKLDADNLAELTSAQKENIEVLSRAAEKINAAKQTAERSIAALDGLTALKLREGVFELEGVKAALEKAKTDSKAFLDTSAGVSSGDLTGYGNIAAAEKEIADFEAYLGFAEKFGETCGKTPEKLSYAETADALEMFENYEALSLDQRAILTEEERDNIAKLKAKADALTETRADADNALGELKQALAENAEKETLQQLAANAEEKIEAFFGENGTIGDLPDYGVLEQAEERISEYEQEEFTEQLQRELGSLAEWTEEKLGELGIPELEETINKADSAIEKIDSSSEKTQETLAEKRKELADLKAKLEDKLTLESAKIEAAEALQSELDRVLSSSTYSGKAKREIESYYSEAIDRISGAETLDEIAGYRETAVSDMNSVEPVHVGWLVADLLLALLLLGEVAYLILRNRKKKKREEKTFSVALPVGLLAVRAAGFQTGVAFFVILLIAVLALGVWIVDLILRERGGKNPLSPVTDGIRGLACRLAKNKKNADLPQREEQAKGSDESSEEENHIDS